jgi:hypothetical protein
LGREDEAAAVLLDLYIDAVVRPVREVALDHALASSFPLDQTSQRGSHEELAEHGHRAGGPLLVL